MATIPMTLSDLQLLQVCNFYRATLC